MIEFETDVKKSANKSQNRSTSCCFRGVLGASCVRFSYAKCQNPAGGGGVIQISYANHRLEVWNRLRSQKTPIFARIWQNLPVLDVFQYEISTIYVRKAQTLNNLLEHNQFEHSQNNCFEDFKERLIKFQLIFVKMSKKYGMKPSFSLIF